MFTQEDGSWLHPCKVAALLERLVTASDPPPIRPKDKAAAQAKARKIATRREPEK